MRTLKHLIALCLILFLSLNGCKTVDSLLEEESKVDESGNLPPGLYDPDDVQKIILDKYYREMVEQAKVIVQNNPEVIRMDGFGRFMGLIENKLGKGSNNDFDIRFKNKTTGREKSVSIQGGLPPQEVWLEPGCYTAYCKNRLESFCHDFEISLTTHLYHGQICHFYLYSADDGWGFGGGSMDVSSMPQFETGQKFDATMDNWN